MLIRMWTIYKHTSPSNKSYIGLTCRDPLRRWSNGHGYAENVKIGKAILKYGWDNFIHEILESGIPTLKEAKEREIYWIDLFDTYKNGYNSTSGGDHVSLIRETNLPVYQLDCDLNIIGEYPTLADAGRAIGIGSSGIMEAVRPDGNQITAGGFYWCLKENYSSEWRPRMDFHKKPVICVETGQIFDSEVDAAKYSGLTQAAISACCYEKTITCNGYHWVFLSNYNECWTSRERIQKAYPTRKRVICIESKETYDSVSEAAAKNNVHRCNIQRACKENRMAGGRHFSYVDNYDEKRWKPHVNQYGKNGKPIICLDTGETFSSIREAGERLNISHSLIARCCSGELNAAHNLHFKYFEE